MTSYVKSTNFAVKDTLLSGNPNKIIRGQEIDIEYTNIQSAVNSKANTNDTILTGDGTAENFTVTGNLEANEINGGTY